MNYSNRYQEEITRDFSSAQATYGFMSKVYALMSVGLVITALVALVIASTPELAKALLSKKWVFIGIIIAEFGLVMFLSAGIRKMSATAATVGFIAYSALNGVTFSVIFFTFTMASITSTFFITAGSFVGLSAFGYLTKRSLNGLGNFCFIGLFGLILASLVNLFMQNHFVYYLLSYIGVFIFAGLTAYDTQKLREIGAQAMDSETAGKYAVIGALELYLDFINLFLFLLRIFGGRR